MNHKPSAEELLARVADHDADAAGEFYDRVGPGLFGLLVRMLGDREAAEEVLEETLAKISGEARRITRAGASVAVALALTARERALERRRAMPRSGTERRAACHFDRRMVLFLPKADEVALLEERRGLLVKVLGQLPQAQRGALEMLVFDGLTETAIAAKLNEPPARVRAGILAALGFLRHRVGAVLRTWTAAI
jgi:RNA polymerase sigma-70 factor, ECF subfamily